MLGKVTWKRLYLCWCGAMAAQLICNQWVAGSTPVTSSKKSYDIPLKSGVCRGAFAFMSPTASLTFRKIMPPGGARVLKLAHHDAAVVFGGVIKSKRPRKKSRGRFCIIGRLSFVQPLSLLRRQGRVAAPSVCCAAACILLAAAPTATPCFRRWRRSSPLPLVGEPLAEPFTLRGLPRPLLQGEVARRRRDGEVVQRRACPL